VLQHVLKVKLVKHPSRATSKLILGFETLTDARRWLNAITKSLEQRGNIDAVPAGVRFDGISRDGLSREPSLQVSHD
jgi:hypothetical protein